MTVTNEFLDANSAYASTFTKGDLPMPPGRKTAVLVCMDARIDPAKALGLEEGDAHVIRNAGGLATPDAIRSLVISYKLLGTRGVCGDPPHRLRHADLHQRADSRPAQAGSQCRCLGD